MRNPADSALLSAWEQGTREDFARRALTLLEAACPETAREALARLPVGQRDGRLLALRERIFGPRVEAEAACPACGDRLEVVFEIADVLNDVDQAADDVWVELHGYQLRCRLPEARDLITIAGASDRIAARHTLLNACVIEVRSRGNSCSLAEVPASVVDALVQRIEALDPQADIQLALSCPACGHAWGAPFDICSFLWRELETWTRHVLAEVHTLARAYGWSEADILALTPQRRRVYLDMVQG